MRTKWQAVWFLLLNLGRGVGFSESKELGVGPIATNALCECKLVISALSLFSLSIEKFVSQEDCQPQCCASIASGKEEAVVIRGAARGPVSATALTYSLERISGPPFLLPVSVGWISVGIGCLVPFISFENPVIDGKR